MKNFPAIDVDHPPLEYAAKITKTPAPRYKSFGAGTARIDLASVHVLVKVVKISVDYWLSIDIEKPGIKPLFLMNTHSKSSLTASYLTDGERLWHVVEAWPTPSPSWPPKNTPVIGEFSYRVTGSINGFKSWEMSYEDMDLINKVIKRYVEKL